MLAEHGLEYRFNAIRIGQVPREIPVDAHPMHIMIAEHFILTNDGDIVFSVTGNHAGTAADT